MDFKYFSLILLPNYVYEFGSQSGNQKSRHNICFNLVDELVRKCP